MNTARIFLSLILMSVFLNFALAQDTLSWDFENGNDHGFDLHCLIPADPAPDDPTVAGDEAITGYGGTYGLPDAGVAWSIGVPNMYDGQIPVVVEGTHIVDNVLQYNDTNDPFGAADTLGNLDFVNGRGQSGYLSTYMLNQWGDNIHTAINDQIATSPKVKLGAGAMLTVWAIGNTTADWAGVRIAPEFDPLDPAEGYADGSGGIAVLSAADGSLLSSLAVKAEGVDSLRRPNEFTLDLADLADQEVVIEVVDAFAGGWGWYAIDEIQITNASLVNSIEVEKRAPIANNFNLSQNYPNPFNPSTTIEFEILQPGHVTLTVFNILGQPVATLIDQKLSSGTYQANFDASNLNTGIYYYRLKADVYSEVKKMLLTK